MSIQIRDLVKRYGSQLVLDHLHLLIQDGEALGLLGSDGAGKSTVIGCLLGLLRYDKGEIHIFGEDINDKKSDIKRKVGMVPQNVTLFDGLTIFENLDYFCNLYLTDKMTRHQYVTEAIQLCGLQEVADEYPKGMDMGTLRCANLACGIVHKPDFLVVDEPIQGAGVTKKQTILQAFQTLQDNGTTILYASRDIEELAGYCNRIAIMDKGKVVITATVEELKNIISVGEKVTIEVFRMKPEEVEEISGMKGVVFANYIGNELVVKSEKGKNNLANVLHYLENHHIPFGKVFSEVPMLKDVFWEITGREL